MILCDGCEKWQHAVCFRIIDDADIPQSHLCNYCAKIKVNKLKMRLIPSQYKIMKYNFVSGPDDRGWQ